MTDTSVSVVIVSRGRPQSLMRTLTGLAQLQYWNYEVVVVADPKGIAAAASLSFAGDLKLVPFDEANISATRNLGVTHAAGEIIAFIDDDAVPEPMWLRFLTAPAARSDVAAMGGYVRGRNGISYQWTAASLDAQGAAHPLTLDPRQASVVTPPKGHAIKTEGTNMAFRREVLVELGAFDPAFHYFLDETDLNMRLAAAGYATALVPLAEVHHGYAPNAMRTVDRVPKDLFDIGASWAVFQRKHISKVDQGVHLRKIRDEQRRRLLICMQSGSLEPRDVRRLLERFDQGYSEGVTRAIVKTALPQHPVAPFRRFPSSLREAIMIFSRPSRAAYNKKKAVDLIAEGKIVTLLNLSPTSLFHKLSFDPAGFWMQSGGIFGKGPRSDPIFAFSTRKRRAEREVARVSEQRGFGRKIGNLLP